MILLSAENLALGKPAYQVSTHRQGEASRAVDGDINPDFAKDSCTYTKEHDLTWWVVDLQNVYSINEVAITSRNFKSML